MPKYSWIPFFEETADKLLDYEARQTELYRHIQNAFGSIDELKIPKIERDDNVTEIDPFTIFAMINRGITLGKRIARCSAFAKELGIHTDVPADFTGVPVADSRRANFISFREDRKPDDTSNLWSLFSKAIRYAEDGSDSTKQDFADIYDKVLKQRGIKWNISMGLFWIRPKYYLSLDSSNRQFLKDPENVGFDFANRIKTLTDVPPSGIEYADICEQCRRLIDGSDRYDSIADLSYAAWQKKSEQSQSDENTGTALADQDVRTVHYWLYAPGENAAYWEQFYQQGILAIGWGNTGDARDFTLRDEIKEKLRQVWDAPGASAIYPSLAVWQLLHDMKIGDVIFVKNGRRKIIGRGVVISDYEYVQDYQIEDFQHQRKVKWTHSGEWDYPRDNAPVKTLTDITDYKGIVDDINSFFIDPDEHDEEMPEQKIPYTAEDFLNDIYMSERDYETLVGLLRSKKNIILQGAPGVGKTYTAKYLAYSMMGVKDPQRVAMVQFHQSYSYEDFIMGFRPTETGFELKKGVFYNFCKKAQDDPGNEYFFIIDEINRGNLSKIFGELFMLIENDKRGYGIQLLYADEFFSVPKNVMIIGMMNTADRSLAMLDYAMRRRFAFFDMEPGFDTEGFKRYQKELADEKFDKLISCVQALNHAIANDESLGDGFRIGHSYFCNLNLENANGMTLMNIVRFELIPLLKEYWFDEPQKVKEWSERLRSAVK